jgi:diguanylate cyclase (GGDEF)-like protein
MRPDEPLIVEDLRKDSRFQGNPLVTHAPHLCFYAGAPLIDRQGYALGTIAVVDTQPRIVNDVQRILLRDLSSLVITALESRHRANQLGHLAMTDHLTGLANRAQFDRTLNSEMAHSRRTHEQFTVLSMDLDGFKGINDIYGHASGDEVLVTVANRMAEQVRAKDLLARLGGDEFAIFLRDNVDNAAKLLAKRIVEVVSAPITLSTGDEVRVGISIGIATRTETINSLSTLLALADMALYEDKRKN